jgi:putative hydrolase of the HAD superfamily
MVETVGLKAAFFDIGGTLGEVDVANLVLHPFATSAQLLATFHDTLRLKVGVITNVPSGVNGAMIRNMLQHAQLLQFLDDEAIVTSADAGVSKPEIGIYLFAAQRAAVSPADCLYVGDEPKQVVGARGAGMVGLLKLPPVP